MVHFDAHPDLSVPSGSRTRDWKDKDYIIGILNSVSGISEFLVPLLYNRRLQKVSQESIYSFFCDVSITTLYINSQGLFILLWL